MASSLGVLGATSLAAATATSVGVAGVITLNATTLSITSAVTATFAGPVTLNNAVTLNHVLTPTGIGRIRTRTRSALAQLEEHVRKLQLNLTSVETELVRRAPKRMVGAERE
jgi:hypothetical protein